MTWTAKCNTVLKHMGSSMLNRYNMVYFELPGFCTRTTRHLTVHSITGKNSCSLLGTKIPRVAQRVSIVEQKRKKLTGHVF